MWGPDDLLCNLRHFPTILICYMAVFTIFEFDFIKSAILQNMETNMCLLFLVGCGKKGVCVCACKCWGGEGILFKKWGVGGTYLTRPPTVDTQDLNIS